MSTDKLSKSEALFISNACKKAISLLMGDLPIMKEAYLEAKSWRTKGGPAFRYWEGSETAIRSILNQGGKRLYAEIKEMGMDTKLLYMMYGASKYMDYYNDVILGKEDPIDFSNFETDGDGDE